MPSCRNLLIVIPPSGENSVFMYWQREAIASCTQGVLLVERGLGPGQDLFLPITPTTPGVPQEKTPSAPWSCVPRETLSRISRAGNFMPRSTPATCKTLKWVHGQLEFCPTLPCSQGCGEPGAGLSMCLGRRLCASPSSGLMKTSVTSERWYVLTGIVI